MRSLQCSKILNILTLKEQSFLLDVGAGPPGSEILNYFNTNYELYPNTLQGYNLLIRSATKPITLEKILSQEKENKIKSIKRFADFHNFRYNDHDLIDNLLIPEISEDLIMLILYLRSKFEKGETLSEEEMQFAQETAFIETYYRDLPYDRIDFNFNDDSYLLESPMHILKRSIGGQPTYENEKLTISHLKEEFIGNPSQVTRFTRLIRDIRSRPVQMITNGLIAGCVNTYQELQDVIIFQERKKIDLDQLEMIYKRDPSPEETSSIRRRICTYQYSDLRPKYDEIMLSLWSRVHNDPTLLMSYVEPRQVVLFDENEFWDYMERSMFSFIMRNLLPRKRLLKFIIWLRLLRRLQLKIQDKIAVVILILLILKIEEFIKFFYGSKRIKTTTSL